MTREKREIYKQKKKIHGQKRRMRRHKEFLNNRVHFVIYCVLFDLVALLLVALIATGTVNAIVVGTTAGDIGTVTAEDGYDTAVVFGAKVHEGGTLSAMLQDRMDTAIELYHAGKVQKLLLSGDGSGEWSEVEYMAAYAVRKGVDVNKIILDGKGYSTIETVERAKQVFGINKCVLVTQTYHLYRAIYAAESMGMEVRGVGADVRTYYGQLHRDVREVLARVKDFSLCIVK